ncbi:MAG: hypothetical protein EBT06_11010 [Gammaproteobacteria bacterium]|nr:hypothetical protein [Gammaproteobacteria bacterium]
MPEQLDPDQPENVLPAPGVAVNVTIWFALKLDVQVVPQLIPVGSLVMVPDPEPLLVTLSVAPPVLIIERQLGTLVACCAAY